MSPATVPRRSSSIRVRTIPHVRRPGFGVRRPTGRAARSASRRRTVSCIGTGRGGDAPALSRTPPSPVRGDTRPSSGGAGPRGPDIGRRSPGTGRRAPRATRGGWTDAHRDRRFPGPRPRGAGSRRPARRRAIRGTARSDRDPGHASRGDRDSRGPPPRQLQATVADVPLTRSRPWSGASSGVGVSFAAVHIDWSIALASVIVGFTVGLTGMGGGALMTPILLIFFGVTPTAAVSSDLVAAMVMKPVGGGVHIRRKTVRWELVRWLFIGSIPAAFGGVLLLHATGDSEAVETTTKVFLGVTLVLAAAAMVFRSWLQARRSAEARAGRRVTLGPGGSIDVRIPITVMIGAVGGLLVGLTSVGSGSIIIVCLMLTYPTLRGSQLVGTDLVQAVPLVTSAALAHILVGDLELGLTASILIGALPAVYVGARLSSKAPEGLIRPAIVLVLLASALKLLEVPTAVLGVILVAVALVGLPIWGAIDAAAHPQGMWDRAGLSRRRWIGWQAFGAPIGIGFAVAAAYFARTRRRLDPATLPPDHDGTVITEPHEAAVP